MKTEQCAQYPHKPHPYVDLFEFGKRHVEVTKHCPGSTANWEPEDDDPVA